MKIQNIEPIQYNNVTFCRKDNTKQQVSKDDYAQKVPVNYDTARAYASYGINKAKDNAIPLNNLSLEINGIDGYDNALVSIINTHEKPIEAKEGLASIRQAILSGYVNAFSNIGITAVAIPQCDGDSLVGVKSSSENINAAISVAKFLSSGAIADKELFDAAKNDIKTYYKENWDDIKNVKEDKKYLYSEFKNEKSLNEICEKIDNISYNDYLKYCENILKMQNNYIGIDIPKSILDNKQINLKDLEKQVLDNTAVKGKYTFKVN